MYIALGDNARALTLLERAATDHDSFFSSESLAERFFDPIRGDPRFAAIVAKVGLDKRLALEDGGMNRRTTDAVRAPMLCAARSHRSQRS